MDHDGCVTALVKVCEEVWHAVFVDLSDDFLLNLMDHGRVENCDAAKSLLSGVGILTVEVQIVMALPSVVYARCGAT
jgi:hypothetical protein